MPKDRRKKEGGLFGDPLRICCYTGILLAEAALKQALESLAALGKHVIPVSENDTQPSARAGILHKQSIVSPDHRGAT